MKKLRAFFLDNLLLKAVSLLLAILLWHQVSQKQVVWQFVSIPLGFKMPEGLVISNDPPNQIEVYARSARAGGVDRNLLSAVIDLPNANPGTQVVQLTEKNINRPAHIDIDSISPSMIRLEIERVVSKAVKVEPQITGEPAPGYEVTSVRVLPGEIRVTGPASSVSRTSSIQTIPINIEGRKEPLTQNAFADLEDLDLRISNDLNLMVNVLIEEKRREIQVPGVAVKVLPAGIAARLESTGINLLGTVPLSWSGELDPELFLVEVDLSRAEPSSQYQDFEPAVTIPPEYATIFRLSRTRPAHVKARRIR